MKKVYLAHPISTKAEFYDSMRVAERIRALGFEVYAAAENASINDKSNDPTPADIYDADMTELLSSDYVVVNLAGGSADGTITELGAVAGYNEMLRDVIPIISEAYPEARPIPIIGYTSNTRLMEPQFYKGIPSASVNHLSLGAVIRWGEFVGGEADMIKEMREIERA